MTDKQKRFVDAYIRGESAKDSAIQAGYSANSANVEANRLLKNPNIQRLLQQQVTGAKKTLKETVNMASASINRVIRQFERMAFLDPAKFFDDKGLLLPVSEMPEDARVALTGLETSKFGTKIRFEGRMEALNGLAKHHGLFQDQPAMQMGLSININGSTPAAAVTLTAQSHLINNDSDTQSTEHIAGENDDNSPTQKD